MLCFELVLSVERVLFLVLLSVDYLTAGLFADLHVMVLKYMLKADIWEMMKAAVWKTHYLDEVALV